MDHLINQDSYFGPKGVRIREVPLYSPPKVSLDILLHKKLQTEKCALCVDTSSWVGLHTHVASL